MKKWKWGNFSTLLSNNNEILMILKADKEFGDKCIKEYIVFQWPVTQFF